MIPRKAVHAALLAAFFWVASAGAAAAQTTLGTLTGRVTDAAGGLPIVSANLIIVGTTAGTQTNGAGRPPANGILAVADGISAGGGSDDDQVGRDDRQAASRVGHSPSERSQRGLRGRCPSRSNPKECRQQRGVHSLARDHGGGHPSVMCMRGAP